MVFDMFRRKQLLDDVRRSSFGGAYAQNAVGSLCFEQVRFCGVAPETDLHGGVVLNGVA